MAKRRAGPRGRRKKSGTRRASRRTIARWQPSKFALWRQRWGDPNNDSQIYPTTVLLRHPSAPFTAAVTTTARNLERKLKEIAHAYLTEVDGSKLFFDPPFKLPNGWLRALDLAHPDPSFGWLPFTPPGRVCKTLFSFWARRTNTHANDSMAILLASQPGGSGFGIRVVAHVRQRSRTRFEISISGMSASLPFGIFRPPPQRLTRVQSLAQQGALNYLTKQTGQRGRGRPRPTDSKKESFREKIAKTHGLEGRTLALHGTRLAPINLARAQGIHFYAEVKATGQKSTKLNATSQKRIKGDAQVSGPREPYYSFVFATELTTIDLKHFNSTSPSLVSKHLLVAHAGTARIFPIDPASQADATNLHHRRPTRSDPTPPDDVLDYYRSTGGPLPSTPNPLIYAPDGYDDEVVFVCPGFVLEDYGIPPDKPKPVDLPGGGPPVRSNDSSAVMAYWNVRQFFDRLRAYGLPPDDYFRITPLPLGVYYRSGIRPGPGKDGQTVNARISVKGFPDNFEGPVPPGSIVDMHLALADLSTRARKPWDGTHRPPAVPLGIAAAARWIGHEIGHVLLPTCVGKLQFRFAHSPGDSLAAIVLDPESELSTDPNWRGSTFPWVFLPRRHDRCVAHGWSWGGTLHYALSQVPDSVGPRRKAYWSEQILSSSLFRLYRRIGGDTTKVGLPSTPP